MKIIIETEPKELTDFVAFMQKQEVTINIGELADDVTGLIAKRLETAYSEVKQYV